MREMGLVVRLGFGGEIVGLGEGGKGGGEGGTWLARIVGRSRLCSLGCGDLVLGGWVSGFDCYCVGRVNWWLLLLS